jgi:hypothetical protein
VIELCRRKKTRRKVLQRLLGVSFLCYSADGIARRLQKRPLASRTPRKIRRAALLSLS